MKQDNRRPLLTICVATYNRELLLERLLSSGMSRQNAFQLNGAVEWIIVDDGSTDNTRAVIDRWRSQFFINYVIQENTGRAKALKKAILLASGYYSVIMDSDDYFSDGGLTIIMHELNRLKFEPDFKGRPLVGALFGTKIISKTAPAGRENLPTCQARTNFIAARADFRCSGDLKEVVETEVLQRVFNETDFDVRRIPTYLWWANISMQGDCLMIRKVVAIKEYMPDGMTANIFCLKMESPAPMAALYKLLSHTLIYDSVRYRIRSKFLWYRYALLSADTTDFSLIDRILLSPAWLIYRVDCLRLTWIRKVGKSE